MKLEIFDFVDDSLKILDKFSPELVTLSSELENFYKKYLSESDYFLNVSSRIKSPMSLKEKILRNNYYLMFSDAEAFFFELSDLIGIRLECRFIVSIIFFLFLYIFIGMIEIIIFKILKKYKE